MDQAQDKTPERNWFGRGHQAVARICSASPAVFLMAVGGTRPRRTVLLVSTQGESQMGVTEELGHLDRLHHSGSLS